MDAAAFLNPTPIPAIRRPHSIEWGFAAAKTVAGAATVWFGVPAVPDDFIVLRGWVGMAGLAFLLHFGLFHLLSCAWRRGGVDAKPLMDCPIAATSLAEFWGRRWNTAFRDLTHRFLFRPLAGRFGPRGALAIGFLASGVVHDLVISIPADGGYGLPTLYFVLQGVGLMAERKLRPGRGWRGRLFAGVVIAGPAYWLFHPPFVTRVVLPFLTAIGAT
jgi:hypothetical protein